MQFFPVLLLLSGCFFLQTSSGSVHRLLSEPLQSHDTFLVVDEVSRHAQDSETESDSSIRLMQRPSADEHHLEICCLHANILDYYLHNILRNHDNLHPGMHQLKNILHRVSLDLTNHGCSVSRYQDHQNAVNFRHKLLQMGGQRGINKAIGEINILFTYLQEYCIEEQHVEPQHYST